MAWGELCLFAQRQLEENPLLELSDGEAEEDDATPGESLCAGEGQASNGEDGFDDPWHPANGANHHPDPDEEPFSPLDRSARTPTLREHLFLQLCSMGEDKETLGVAQALTEWLDADGYLRSPQEELAQALQVEPDLITRGIQLLHRLDPPGIGAKNLQECLLIQLARRELAESLAARIVKDHFDLLARRRLSTLSTRLKVSLPQIQEASRIIGGLEPKPARNFATEVATPLHPDLIVKQTPTGFEVDLNDEGLPCFRLSRTYQNLLRCPTTPREAKQFIREKTRQGRWLMRAIQQRNQTLLAIAREVVREEQPYLEGGVQFLKPLTQEEIARRLGCHASTVSRAIAGKSMQTPFGVTPLETFFGGGICHPQDASRRLCPQAIQAELAQIIAGENQAQPMSDQALAELLTRRGYPVARRTVAKYRTQLKIPPAYLRHAL